MKKIFLGFCCLSFFLGLPVSAGVGPQKEDRTSVGGRVTQTNEDGSFRRLNRKKQQGRLRKLNSSPPSSGFLTNFSNMARRVVHQGEEWSLSVFNRYNGFTQGCDAFMKSLLEVPYEGIQESQGPIWRFVTDNYEALRQRSFGENVTAVGETFSALRKDPNFSFTLAAATVLGYVPPFWVEEREGATPGTSQMPESASGQAGNAEFQLHKVRELPCKSEDENDLYIYLMSEYRIYGSSGINGVCTELRKKKKNEIDSNWEFAGGKMGGIPEKLLQNSNLKTRETMTWKEIGHSFVCSIFQQLYVDTKGKLRHFSWRKDLQYIYQEIQKQDLPAFIVKKGKAVDESLIKDPFQVIGFASPWVRVSEEVRPLVYKIIDGKIYVSELIADLMADCREMHEVYQTRGVLAFLEQRVAVLREEMAAWRNFIWNRNESFQAFGFGDYLRIPEVSGVFNPTLGPKSAPKH